MKKEIKIALLFFVILFVSIWGYNFISGKNMFSGDQIFYAYYSNVQDVNTATPVAINGYEVGSIITIDPDPDDIRRIRLGFTVKKDIRLPDYTVAKLVPISPLGGKVLELEFDKMCDGTNCAPNKSVLKGETMGIIGSMINQDELEPTIESITAGIDATLGQLGAEDSDDAVDVGIRNLAITLENFAGVSGRLETLLSRSSRDMEKTISNMATLTESLVASNEKVNGMLDNLSKVTQDLEGAKLSETINQTNSTMGEAQKSLENVGKTMEQATATLTELKDIMAKIESGEGSIGKMLNDEELYNNIESSTRNLDLLLQDLRLNPRRYFKLFGKKVPEYEYPEDDPAAGKEDK